VAIRNEKLNKDWFILSTLVSKDFKRKYRRSILGVVWSVLNPLLMMIVISLVFSYLFKFDIPNYPVYLILGQTLYNFMANSTTNGLASIIESASMIKKIKVNKLIFPLSKVIFELVNFALSLVAVALVFAFYRIVPGINLALLPLLMVYMMLFCSGLAMALAALEVFFRDVMHLWSVATTAWMYATPVMYPLDILHPLMIQAMQFNPMYHFITYFRMIAFYGETPSLELNLLCLGMAASTFLVGLLIFTRSQKRFILYV